MENVMTSAWEIAYEGVAKFGGKVKEYFSAALKIAWNLSKNVGKEMDHAQQVKGTIAKLEAPKLEGSEKQISWAEEIRKKAISTLLNGEVMYEQYEVVSLLPHAKPKTESRPVKTIIQALMSEEGIKAIFDKMQEKSLPESRFEGTVKSMNDALDRYARFTEIAMNTDAKFWIDNRDNQARNYMFKAFKEYVSIGVIKF